MSKKLHWTQRPENAARVKRLLRKAQRARLATKTRPSTTAPVLRAARLQVLAAIGAEIELARLEAEIVTLRAFLNGGKP